MRRWLAFVVVVAACGTSDVGSKKSGETCVASSECAAGLLCDLAQTPHICAGMSIVDAAPPDAMIDAHPLRDAP